MATPLERPQPVPTHLIEERPQRAVVPGHGEVSGALGEHPMEPLSRTRDRVVHSFAKLCLEVLEPASHSLLHRLAPNHERAVLARVRAEVGEAKEVERVRLPLSARLPVRNRVSSKLDDSCLIRVQLQVKRRQALLQLL